MLRTQPISAADQATEHAFRLALSIPTTNSSTAQLAWRIAVLLPYTYLVRNKYPPESRPTAITALLLPAGFLSGGWNSAKN